MADEVEAALRRARRPVVQVADVDEAARRLRHVRTLVFAGVVDLERALSRTAALLDAGPTTADQTGQAPQRATRRSAATRILLLSDSRQPLPASVAADAALAFEHIEVERRAARLLLARWPLHIGCDPLFGQDIHLLIAGRAPPADALLLHALRLAHYSERPPVITLLSDSPDAWRAEFEAKHPQARAFSLLHFRSLRQWDLASLPAVTSAMVLVDPPTRGLAIAEQLTVELARGQGSAPPILLDVGDAEPRGALAEWDGQIIPFSHRRMVLDAESLLDGREDDLARVVHEHYRDTTLAQGRDPAAEPSALPWQRLVGSYRDANRHQADHLWAKLAVTDCRAVPEELVESFAFAPAEVERLAVIEHARWAADRYLDGWTYAPTRDNRRKQHPQLVPYAELSGPMKDLDRFAVRLVPTLLARSGLGLVRMLILGLSEVPAADSAAGRLRPLIDQMLRRLQARYPDRGLMIATSLADAPSRLLARQALASSGAGLFLLCARPLAETLAAQPNADARRELLTLTAKAERRISLQGADALQEWLDARAEIVVDWGAGQSVPPSSAGVQGKRKRVRLDADSGLHWSFEY